MHAILSFQNPLIQNPSFQEPSFQEPSFQSPSFQDQQHFGHGSCGHLSRGSEDPGDAACRVTGADTADTSTRASAWSRVALCIVAVLLIGAGPGCATSDRSDPQQDTARPRRFNAGDLWRSLDSRSDVDPSWVATILDAGVDPNITRSQGETPLHIAARWSAFAGVSDIDIDSRNDWYEVLELLLEHGADPNVQNQTGHTPLHDASIPGDARTAELLLSQGAQPNSFDRDGESPLFAAISLGNDNPTEIVQVLLDYGADPYARNATGRSTCELIVQNEPGRSLRWAQLLEKPAALENSGYADHIERLPADLIAALLALNDNLESNQDARATLKKSWSHDQRRDPTQGLLQDAVHWELRRFHDEDPLRAARALLMLEREFYPPLVDDCVKLVRESRPLQRPGRHRRVLLNATLQYLAPFADRPNVQQALREYVESDNWRSIGSWEPMAFSGLSLSRTRGGLDSVIDCSDERRASRKWSYDDMSRKTTPAHTIFFDLPRFLERYRGDPMLLITLLDHLGPKDKLAADRLDRDGFTPSTLFADPERQTLTPQRRVLQQILAPNDELIRELKRRLDTFITEDREFALEILRRAELQ